MPGFLKFLPNIGDPAVTCGGRDVRFWSIVLIRLRSPYDCNQPEAAFKCKRHSLNAPFVGALIESKWFG